MKVKMAVNEAVNILFHDLSLLEERIDRLQAIKYTGETKVTDERERLTTSEHSEAHADKIKGYRRLTDNQTALINKIKAQGEQLRDLVNEVNDFEGPEGSGEFADSRWLAMANTDLQVGIMKLVRSVAKPDGF